MSSALTFRSKFAAPTSRILLVEPDRSRAIRLHEILRTYPDIELQAVANVTSALRSFAERIPDLVLTSTFLSPIDEASLTKHLKGVRAASHVQVIALPYFIDPEDDSRSEGSSGTILSFLRGRSALARPRCDARTLRHQIKEYLSQAKARRLDLDSVQLREDARHARNEIATRAQRQPEMGLVPVKRMPASARPSVPGLPSDRRRAPRRRASDVPWLCTVRVPGVSRVSVVDISSAGVLLETTTRLVDGTVQLELLGQDSDVSVPARMVRMHVAAVDGMGVRYHAAVAFAREIDLVGLHGSSRSPLTPRALGDLLSRVLSEIDRSEPAALRGRFEQEVRRLLRVRDVRIRQTPAIAERGADSVYFTIPSGSATPPILQAVFDPDYTPTASEFRLLKAAARLAAVVLEFAPLGQPET